MLSSVLSEPRELIRLSLCDSNAAMITFLSSCVKMGFPLSSTDESNSDIMLSISNPSSALICSVVFPDAFSALNRFSKLDFKSAMLLPKSVALSVVPEPPPPPSKLLPGFQISASLPEPSIALRSVSPCVVNFFDDEL